MATIITGGSRGIGLATALRLAKAGHETVLVARDEATLKHAVNQVRAVGAACEGHVADVGRSDQANDVIEFTCARFGKVDVVINNAGAAPMAKISDLSDAIFDQLMSVNVAAVFYMTRAAWRVMSASGGGAIVNISSVASIDPFPGFSVYGACKNWVNAFTKAAADEGRALGIRVFAVAPGAVETRMLRDLFPTFPADATLAPDDVAGVIESILDPRMGYATGQTVFVKR